MLDPIAKKAGAALKGEWLSRCEQRHVAAWPTRQHLGVIISPAPLSHSLAVLYDNPQPSHTLSRCLNDAQPCQVPSQEHKSVLCVSLCQKIDSKKGKKKKQEKGPWILLPLDTMIK